jgi:insulysin
MAAAPPLGADWTRVPPTGTRPAYHVFAEPIERSQQDDREYRLLRLENGLEVALVSDPNGDKAAASLDVGVGHLFDPVSLLGLPTRTSRI